MKHDTHVRDTCLVVFEPLGSDLRDWGEEGFEPYVSTVYLSDITKAPTPKALLLFGSCPLLQNNLQYPYPCFCIIKYHYSVMYSIGSETQNI